MSSEMSLTECHPNFSLKGKSALITGAGRGIGLASARALAAAGADVTLVARTEDEIKEAADGLSRGGASASYAVLDMHDTSAVSALVEKHDPFNILVNNAGTNRPEPFLNVSEENFDAIMGLNVRAAFFVAQAVAQKLTDAGVPGSIINISSQMGHVGAENRTVYCASKHAMEGMTKAMAIELAPRCIRVNTVCPTFIETPMTSAFFASPSFRESVLNQIPLGRVGTVDDITGAIVFLASDASSLVTGSALKVDGGWTAG